MPNINQMRDSKFLIKEDVGRGALMTIKEVYQENVAKQGAPEELKWCMSFDEAEKPMVLNSTNMQLIARALGNEDTDHWIGHQIVLYNDPNVQFGGRVTGGIRCRAPRPQAAKPGSPAVAGRPAMAPRPAQAPVPPSDDPGFEQPPDEVPFHHYPRHVIERMMFGRHPKMA